MNSQLSEDFFRSHSDYIIKITVLLMLSAKFQRKFQTKSRTIIIIQSHERRFFMETQWKKKPVKELKEKLFPSKKKTAISEWKEEIKASTNFAENYKKFLDTAKTEREAVYSRL